MKWKWLLTGFFIILGIVAVPSYRLFSSIYFFVPYAFWTPQAAYRQVKDPAHPTVADFTRIQNALLKGKRPELDLLGDMKKRYSSLKIIEEKKAPESGIVHVNCTGEEKENCLLVYATLNKNYVGGLRRLVEFVSKSDFQGDILYRVGGWPNTEGGDLTLAHVPYAFKVSFFREAKRLGYKRVLWLDTAILPVVSLNTIFQKIREKGYFLMGNGQMVGPHFNATAAASLGISLEDSFQIPSCSAGLFGVDFSNSQVSAVIDRWYQAARDPWAFFSARSDQNVLSILMHQAHLTEWVSGRALVEVGETIGPEALFLIDRGFVQKWKK